MLISVANNITVHNPSIELINWCEQNLTMINPEYAKKVRMGFWVGNTPKVLCLYEMRGNALVLPYGTLHSLPTEITDNALFISGFTTPVRVDYKADIPLYDYQEVAVEEMVKARFGILQSPAGSGKTQMGLALTAKLGVRTLWLCHTLDLVKQSRDRAKRYISDDLIGTISEGKVNIGTGITFATVQTMSKLDLSQYRDYWDCIITDEVHRVSGTPTSVTLYQKVLNSLLARHKYGLSATVHRSDGLIKATYALVGEVAYQVSDEAVASKIMPVGIYPINTKVTINGDCLNTDGTLNYNNLITHLVEHGKRNELIVLTMVNQRIRPSLILSDRLSHLERLIELLPDYLREQSVMISGRMTSKKGKVEREQAIDDMRTGKKKYLFATYSLAKEGLDIPCLERLYLTTPQKDYAVITQSIGRIARNCEGKDDPIAYDFVDDIGYLIKSFKKRCTTYQKNNCYLVESERK